MLLATYDGNVWYASLYDLDASWGGLWRDLKLRGYDKRTNLNRNQLFKRLEQNFKEELADRYFELRKDNLNLKSIMNEFKKFKNSIPQETFELEQAKWGNLPGHEISQIEDFIKTRTPLLDEYFNGFYEVKPEDSNSNFIVSITLTIISIIVLGYFVLKNQNKY